MVAVFVGATSGIGLSTLKQFAKYSNAPKVYVVGRSKQSATPLLHELEVLNPKGIFIFVETEISLIKNVDAVCEEIKTSEQMLDLVFLSPGFLSVEGRKDKSPEYLRVNSTSSGQAASKDLSHEQPNR
ncbi:hypothetical protein V1520DRAFT_20189 [Lipomyces starkeyi]|uniref:Ketoreductase (KR) domain-containing protein n=1 Tax=Lipomyces starkeyi NRRL Y-11557 TaxID=675824 RepID=A0A1E3PYF1_LIPST|nr:hypothetical protein LIPSTDRAFT_5899 [Lipomyces starkeyi NRRL Y-11557]